MTMLIGRPRAPLLCSVLLLACVSALDAQQVTIGLAVSRSDNAAIESMRGPQVQFTTPLTRGAIGFRLGAMALRRSATGTGVPCAGLIEPGTCEPEPIREKGGVTMATAGLEFDVLNRAATRLSVHVDGGFGRLTTETVGSASGRRLSVSRGILGAFGGADASWWPRDGRVGITVGAAAGWGHQIGGTGCVDCYEPFAGGFSLDRVHAGVSVRRRP